MNTFTLTTLIVRVQLITQGMCKDFMIKQKKSFKFIKTANITYMNSCWYDLYKEYSNDDEERFFY